MNSMSDLLGPARLLATPIQDVQGNSIDARFMLNNFKTNCNTFN